MDAPDSGGRQPRPTATDSTASWTDRHAGRHGRTSARLTRSGPLAAAVSLVVTLLAVGCAVPGETSENPAGVQIRTPEESGVYRGIELEPPYAMPDVTLTDTSRQPFNLVRDTRKPLTLAFFGYINCPDICPTVVADATAAVRRLPDNARQQVQFVFITTDPRRDTPQALRTWLDRFDESYIGLTGPMSTIKQAAKPLDVSITGTTKQEGGGYTVGHTGQLFAFTADDKAHLLWTPGTPVGDLRATSPSCSRLPPAPSELIRASGRAA